MGRRARVLVGVRDAGHHALPRAPGRGRSVVQDTLGPDYAGVVISDCLAVYDGLSSPQQKCYAHHLRVVSAVIADGPSPDAEQWRQLLTGRRLA